MAGHATSRGTWNENKLTTRGGAVHSDGWLCGGCWCGGLVPIEAAPQALLSMRGADDPCATGAAVDEHLTDMVADDALGRAAAERLGTVGQDRNDSRILVQLFGA